MEKVDKVERIDREHRKHKEDMVEKVKEVQEVMEMILINKLSQIKRKINQLFYDTRNNSKNNRQRKDFSNYEF